MHLPFIQQGLSGVGASIHDVDLGDTSDRPDSVRVNAPRQVQGLVVGDILVCRDDTENDGAGFLHVFLDHVCGNLVDVFVLPVDCDPGQPGQIDDGQVGAVGRIDV